MIHLIKGHNYIQIELVGWFKAVIKQVPFRKVAKREKVVEKREKHVRTSTVPDEKQVVVKRVRINSKSIALES